MITIAGFITDFDKWERLRVMYPEQRTGTDTLNTARMLRGFDKKYNDGWSPLSHQTFLIKRDKGFAYSSKGDRIRDFSLLIAHSAIFEVEFLPFSGDAKGWFIRLHSIRLTD